MTDDVAHAIIESANADVIVHFQYFDKYIIRPTIEMQSLIDITTGRYYHRNSAVHRLDPRTKLLALLILIVSIFLVRNLWGFLAIASFILLAIFLARLPLLVVLRGLRPMAWIFASIMILHIFFANGDSKLLFSVGPVRATWYGVYSGIMVSCRFVMIVLGAAILTLTTVPLRLADGITEILRPLRRIRLPVTQLPIMILITLHFIPVLFMEAQKLVSAQKARGARFEGANVLRRLKNLLPIFAPLLKNSFRRADELAVGMESRCYRGVERTHLYELTFSRTDGIALAFVAVMILLTVAINEIS